MLEATDQMVEAITDEVLGSGAENSTTAKQKQQEQELHQQQPLSLLTEGTTTIGVFGKPLARIRRRIDRHNTEDERLFDAVMNDLRLDAFPRFEVRAGDREPHDSDAGAQLPAWP